MLTRVNGSELTLVNAFGTDACQWLNCTDHARPEGRVYGAAMLGSTRAIGGRIVKRSVDLSFNTPEAAMYILVQHTISEPCAAEYQLPAAA